MDQIRKILAWLKQYHFWLLSVLIVLIPLVCWWSGAGAMSKQFAESKGKIEQGFSQVTAVQSKPFHPNEGISQLQQEENNKLQEDVKKLWQTLYDSQREAVLVWPPELDAKFIETVEKLKFGADIPDEWLEHYQNYIQNHFPKLPEKIKARDQAGQAGSGGALNFSRMSPRMPQEGPGPMSASGELEDDGNYLCEWAPEDQAAVRGELEFSDTPSSLRIWWNQENLWVYHTLLNVIRNTNDAAKATRISNAPVRRIYSLQVGRAAAPFSRQPNRLLVKLATAAPAEAGAEAVSGAGVEAPGGPEGPAGFSGGNFEPSALGATGQMSEEQERGMLLSHRYLGEDGKPIPYGAAANPEAPAEPPDLSIPAPPLDLTMFGKEYKRLPVRMVLEIDQRHLPKLIAECAMQPLQIEVQEVRVNAADILGGAGGGTTRMNLGEGGLGGITMPDVTGLQQFNAQPEIATVAIQGVIYIFNEPNMELLAPPTEDAGAVAQAP